MLLCVQSKKVSCSFSLPPLRGGTVLTAVCLLADRLTKKVGRFRLWVVQWSVDVKSKREVWENQLWCSTVLCTCCLLVMSCADFARGGGTPSLFFPPLSIHCPIFCSFFTFPIFLLSFTIYFLLSYIPSPFLPEYYSHSISRPEVVGGDQTWV